MATGDRVERPRINRGGRSRPGWRRFRHWREYSRFLPRGRFVAHCTTSAPDWTPRATAAPPPKPAGLARAPAHAKLRPMPGPLPPRFVLVGAMMILAACGGGHERHERHAATDGHAPGGEPGPRGAASQARGPQGSRTQAPDESATDENACVSPDRRDNACPHREGGPSAAPDREKEGRFGGEFHLAETSRHGLARAVAKIDETQGSPVQVTGFVGAVCQRRGCWMTLTDGDVQARVLMKGHFSVPTDSQGRAAIVEGTLTQREFSQAQAKHLADDGGEDPSSITGPRREIVLTATAVELLPRT
ncbi:MAG: DUF4920 domain-containing protein [Myxococcales bacterium FL481]|nr:MAG: DUF4920 domain-containing protein [Myxococcales bacterium FL481]